MVRLHFEVYHLPIPAPPTFHPIVSTHDPTLLVKLLRFSTLFLRETLQAATNTGSSLKGNRLMHFLHKFHTCRKLY